MLVRSLIRTLALAGALLPLPAVVYAQAPDAGNKPVDWPYTFPLWGAELAKQGVKFPLPWGIGINYAFVNQSVDITRLAVGIDDGEMVDLSDVIVFEDVSSKVHVLNLRFDLWLLPFLNVYALGNYAMDVRTSVKVAEPFELNAGAVQTGYGGGFGFTLAGGAWGFFGTLDLNWTWNKMEKLDAPVGTFILAPRVGKNLGKLGGVEWIVWVGAMRQVVQSQTRGAITLSDALGDVGAFQDKLADWYAGLTPPQQAAASDLVERLQGVGDAVIHYDLDKAIEYTWNMLVGTEVGLSREWRVRTEVGFIHRTSVIIGLNYRFGGFVSSPGGAPP